MRNQHQCCMSSSLYDHSSITITIEMPDFDYLHRQFQTRLSHLLCREASATECRLCTDIESATMAVARPATTEYLLQKGGRPLCCARCASSRAQGRCRPPAVAGSVSFCAEHHCPATAANQRQMHCVARCRPPASDDGA